MESINHDTCSWNIGIITKDLYITSFVVIDKYFLSNKLAKSIYI